MENKSYAKQFYVTPKEAAEILGVGYRTVRKMIQSGKLRATNTNATGNQRKYWKVLKEDLFKTEVIESKPSATQ